MANGTPSGTVTVVSDANRWGEIVAFGFMVKEDERKVLWLWFLPPNMVLVFHLLSSFSLLVLMEVFSFSIWF